MTRDEFLARPENARLRQLADRTHPAYRGEYGRLVDELVADANGAPAPKPAPVPTRSQVARVNCCLYRECAEGCQMSRCHAGRSPRPDGRVSLYDCLTCLTAS